MDDSLVVVRIYLLGRFEISRAEHVLRNSDWSRRKAAALLQRIALERRLVKDQAIDFLWPEASLADGANNLYRTLHALRQTLNMTLGPGTAEATFTFTDGVLSLNESVWVDVHEFERLGSMLSIQPSDQPSEPQAARLQQTLALYQGDLLPDELYADWSLTARETLRRLYREACLSLAIYYGDARNYPEAMTLLTPLLAYDPADEPVHRQLMRLYTLTGRRHDALRQYQSCVEALAVELDVPPEPETTALYAQILKGELTPLPPSAPPIWMPPAPIALEVERSLPLVGRDTELETLRAWTQVAWRGQGQTILLAGDAGVGKTRLAYEILRAAASAGMITLFGVSYEQEGQLAYQPFVEAFDRYLVEHPRHSDENPITHFQAAGSTDPQQEQWALFKATATFLTRLASQNPVVLLVDDLHATDESSLHLFHYLARQTRTDPVILLATYRTDIAIPAASPFDILLNAFYRERLSKTLHLIPLREAPVSEIVAYILGGEIAPSLVKAIFDVTEGNPFFVQEVAHTLLKADQLEMSKGEWTLKSGAKLSVPTGLGGLLRERVARLGPPVETTLITASVIGREFNFDVLRGITTLSDGELLDALDIALSSHFLEETYTGYRFRHTLIRRVLYDSPNQTRRAWLHTQIAETIETVYGQRPEGLTPYVEMLAFHYDLSRQRGRALPYLLQAGQKAAGVYAFEVAVDYFERALALMDQFGLADPAQRWPILEALGWWGIILADTPRTVARFEQALALQPTEGWQPTGADRARLHRGAAMALITAGDTNTAEKHLRAALAGIDKQENAADYAYVLYNVAQLHWHRNEYQQAFDAAQQSLAIAERLNEPIAVARAFEMLALACHSLGEWRQGFQFEEQRSALSGSQLDVTEAFDVHL
jgi:DNA-binding SARP family transcriptional activator